MIRNLTCYTPCNLLQEVCFPPIHQSVSSIFLSTIPLKPLHRISQSSFHLLSEINNVSQKTSGFNFKVYWLVGGLLVGAVDCPSWEHVVFTAHYNKHMNLRGKKRLDNWTDGSWRDLIMDFKKRL